MNKSIKDRNPCLVGRAYCPLVLRNAFVDWLIEKDYPYVIGKTSGQTVEFKIRNSPHVSFDIRTNFSKEVNIKLQYSTTL